MSLHRPSPARANRRGRHMLAGLALTLAVSACDGSESERAASARPEDRPGPMVVREREDRPQPPTAPAPVAVAVAAAATAAAAAVEAAAAAGRKQRLANCAEGIVYLQSKTNGFRGPTAERNALRTEVDTALAAYRTSDPEDCLQGLNRPFAALGFSFTPRLEEIPCANGLVGTILQLPRLRRDFQRQEVQALVDVAAAALEVGDMEACWATSMNAFAHTREYLEAQ